MTWYTSYFAFECHVLWLKWVKLPYACVSLTQLVLFKFCVVIEYLGA